MRTAPSTPTTLYARAILFDMDGVLVDSTASDERCWLRWAQLHGMEGTFSLHSTHGRRAVDTIHALRPDLDPYAELRRLEHFDTEDTTGTSALPGAIALLATLTPTAWAIVTSAPSRLAKSRLHVAGIPLPHHLISADDVSHGKPHPEPYELGASKLGLAPSDCLVIEDSPAGIQSAKAAGCQTLAVLTSHAIDALVAADWIVPSLDHVAALPAPNKMLAIHCNLARQTSTPSSLR